VPSAVDGLDGSHYAFLFRRPSALDYPAPVRFTTPRKRLLTELDHFGIGYANYDRLLATDLGTAIEADVDPDAVGRTLVGSGYHRAGSRGAYDLFARPDVPRRAAVGDGAIVWSSRRVHAVPDVEALLDARAGRIERYHEASGTYRRLSEVIGESRMVELVPPEDERYWTKCEGFRFDGTTAYHVMAFLYPEGRTPPEAELRERAAGGTVLTREVENSDFRIDGRLVVVEGRIPAGRGIPPHEITPPYPPQITWGYERGEGTLTLRHEAGASVPTDDLHLRYEADAPGGLWTVPQSEPLPTDAGTLGPGDGVTLDLEGLPPVRAVDGEEVDWDAEDPYAGAEEFPPSRVRLAYSPESSYRTVFEVDLETEGQP
jgi:hypothetical protein